MLAMRSAFVGTMMGITNTVATLSGFIGPAVVGALTYRNVSTVRHCCVDKRVRLYHSRQSGIVLRA